jgi:hypothetical protein
MATFHHRAAVDGTSSGARPDPIVINFSPVRCHVEPPNTSRDASSPSLDASSPSRDASPPSQGTSPHAPVQQDDPTDTGRSSDDLVPWFRALTIYAHPSKPLRIQKSEHVHGLLFPGIHKKIEDSVTALVQGSLEVIPGGPHIVKINSDPRPLLDVLQLFDVVGGPLDEPMKRQRFLKELARRARAHQDVFLVRQETKHVRPTVGFNCSQAMRTDKWKGSRLKSLGNQPPMLHGDRPQTIIIACRPLLPSFPAASLHHLSTLQLMVTYLKSTLRLRPSHLRILSEAHRTTSDWAGWPRKSKIDPIWHNPVPDRNDFDSVIQFALFCPPLLVTSEIDLFAALRDNVKLIELDMEWQQLWERTFSTADHLLLDTYLVFAHHSSTTFRDLTLETLRPSFWHEFENATAFKLVHVLDILVLGKWLLLLSFPRLPTEDDVEVACRELAGEYEHLRNAAGWVTTEPLHYSRATIQAALFRADGFTNLRYTDKVVVPRLRKALEVYVPTKKQLRPGFAVSKPRPTVSKKRRLEPTSPEERRLEQTAPEELYLEPVAPDQQRPKPAASKRQRLEAAAPEKLHLEPAAPDQQRPKPAASKRQRLETAAAEE